MRIDKKNYALHEGEKYKKFLKINILFKSFEFSIKKCEFK